MATQIRQGDVLVEIVPNNRWGGPRIGDYNTEDVQVEILALGEKTGHNHVAKSLFDKTVTRFVPATPQVATTWQTANETYFSTKKGGILEHETPTGQGDHFAHYIPAGTIRRIQQRMYDPSTKQAVIVRD